MCGRGYAVQRTLVSGNVSTRTKVATSFSRRNGDQSKEDGRGRYRDSVVGVIRKFRPRAGACVGLERLWKRNGRRKRWAPRVLELSSTRISPRGVKIFFHRLIPATDTHAPWPPRSSLSSVPSRVAHKPSFERFITEARVIACPRLSHSRSLSTTCETLTRRFPKLMREFRWERNDATIRNDRTAIFHYPLAFFLSFFFSRAPCCTSMHVFTVLFFEDFNLAAIRSFIWFDSISFEFLFVFNTVQYIRVGAIGNCE